MNKYILVILIFPLLLLGCENSNLKWTDEEKQNIQHYYRSTEASKNATRIANRGSAYSKVTVKEAKEMIRLNKLALSEAKLVKDKVLTKAHIELPNKFRNLYQRSLELQISSLTTGNMKDEIESVRLHDAWVDWINSNKDLIKTPE